MRYLLFLFALAALCAQAAPSGYRERRAELRKAAPNGVVVLFGRTERETEDSRSGFFQEPNFYYLTGWNEPGAVLVLEPAREVLFLPRKDPDKERWTGPKVTPDDAGVHQVTGFDVVMPVEQLESALRSSLDQYPRLYTLTGTPGAERLAKLAPLREISGIEHEIARMRMKKSPQEIALIQRSTDVAIEAHRAAWKRAAPGLYEYQIAATLTDVFFDRGCERNAYPPIVGSALNATILHYSRNKRRMDRGELLLMDAAPECAGYASDITRTIPVGARFNKRQREIYEIVLGAQKAAIAAIKPGVMINKTSPNSIYKVALGYINAHGKDRHGEPLGKYFIHGLSHHVGLEVHDASDATAPLEPGMVITVEPGIYIPEENIGVRIEDVVLVTEDGARVLSGALPREADEIERELRRN